MKSIPLIAAIVLTSASISPAVAAPPLIVKGHVLAGFGHRAPSLHSAQTQTAAKQARNLHSTMNMQVAPPEQYTIIDAPDAGAASGQGTTAIFVDSLGGASGYYADSDNNYHSFLRAADGTLTEFDIDGPASQTIVHWGNSKGATIGDYFNSAVSQYQGFLRKVSGKV